MNLYIEARGQSAAESLKKTARELMRRSLFLREAATQMKNGYTYQIETGILQEKREARERLGKAASAIIEAISDNLEGEAIATFIAAERAIRPSAISETETQAAQRSLEKARETLHNSIGNRENVGPNHGVPQETEM